jgi:hypothetical protein
VHEKVSSFVRRNQKVNPLLNEVIYIDELCESHGNSSNSLLQIGGGGNAVEGSLD